MNIYVINKSTVLKDADVQSWIPALNKYAHLVAEYWPRPATVIWCPRDKEPTTAWKLVFADTSDEAGALGYHDFTPDGRPISYVFAKDDLKYGYTVTGTATHEIAEMIADPWISELFQVSDTQLYAKEVCDPCEADELGFVVSVPGFPALACSDFVLPKWFIPGSTGKFDKTGHLAHPLQLAPGGYMSVFVSGKGWKQIYAETAGHGRLARKADGTGEKHRHGYSRLERYARSRPEPAIKL